MAEEIKNDIDKIDGMIKIKGKCGYEIIGGCSDLRRLKQENKELKEENIEYDEELAIEKLSHKSDLETLERYRSALEEIKNVLKEVCKEECDYTKPKFCGDCDCRYGQILNKINEILN